MQEEQLAVQQKLKEIFSILGFNMSDPSIKDTPKRIAKMWCDEICTDLYYKDIHELDKKMTFFDNVEGSKQPITMTMPFVSWCFTGKTSIMTPKGAKFIRDIQVGDEVVTMNEDKQLEIQKVKHLFKSTKNELLEISTSKGKRVKCTLNHPIFIEDKGWTNAEDIQVGDRVRTLRNYRGYSNPNRNPITHINYDENLGYVLGTICSDGSTHRNNISLEVKEEWFALNFATSLRNAFGIESKVEPIQKTSSFTKESSTYYRVRVVNGHLVEIIKELLGSTKSKDFRLPKVIFNNYEILRGFYQAYMDGDGTENNFAIYSSNLQFIQDTCNVFGTSSYKSHGLKSDVHVVTVPKFIFGKHKRDLEKNNFIDKFNTTLKNDDPIQVALDVDLEIITEINYFSTNRKPYTVYNFEVENNNTYIANGIWVHNCEHHLLPFFGEIRVTYSPNEKIIGLSKIPRIVEYFSKRPQLQERLGKEIAEYLCEIADARQVRVDIFNTTHTCVSCRGIQYNADTQTSYVAKGRND